MTDRAASLGISFWGGTFAGLSSIPFATGHYGLAVAFQAVAIFVAHVAYQISLVGDRKLPGDIRDLD